MPELKIPLDEAKEIELRDLRKENKRLQWILESIFADEVERQENIDRFCKEAMPMIAELYKAMKKAKGSLDMTGYQNRNVKSRKAEVINRYSKDMALIKPEWLEDDSLYIFRRRQAIVDFYGRLLQRSLKELIGIDCSARYLGERAKAIRWKEKKYKNK